MPSGVYNHKKGKHLSEETKRKMSISKIGKKRPGFTGGNNPFYGKHHSKETIAKFSASLKGKIPWNKGKKGLQVGWNKGTKGIMKSWCKGKHLLHSGSFKKGKLHPNWKGGITRNKHSITEPRYKQWRSDIFMRDNWTCQTCGKRSKIGEKLYLEAHHIKSWSKYPELRYEISNGVCLCKECHKLTKSRCSTAAPYKKKLKYGRRQA